MIADALSTVILKKIVISGMTKTPPEQNAINTSTS